MAISAIFLHGEQLIPVFLALVIAGLAALLGLGLFMRKALGKKLGKASVLIVPAPFVVVIGLFAVQAFLSRPNTGPPRFSSAAAAAAELESASYSGIAHFHGAEFVGTNVGLAEIKNQSFHGLYKTQRSDSVVSGPWLDRADDLLWIRDDHTNELLKFDGAKWTRIPMPMPAKGYYSRGEVLEGSAQSGNAHGFWMVSGGGARRWNLSANRWDQAALTEPTNFDDRIIGVLAIGETPFFILRHELLDFTVHAGEDFKSDTVEGFTDGWRSISNTAGKFFAETTAVTADAGYICTRASEVLQISRQSVSKLKTPGECETLTSDETSSLIASFKGKGIYRFDGKDWQQIAVAPYSGEGEYWTYLAAQGNDLVYAISAKPVVDRAHSVGSDMKFTTNAPTALWFITNGIVRKADFRR
jgi:hypothetical protein